KPSNIFISSLKQIKFTDFLIPNYIQTIDQMIVFDRESICYMAPELLLKGEVSKQADIFSLGIILYQLLTGKIPCPNDFIDDLIQDRGIKSIAPLDAIVRAIPEQLDQIYQRSTSFDMAKRYQHIDDMFADLKQVLD
ncbi:protein kinase, partial [candidate division KSB1 bacterium]|nr:protein kinase [candidate division KSB1 bacterium]